MKFTQIAVLAALSAISTVYAKLKDGECEVCISVVNQFIKAAEEEGANVMDSI